jgi:predicted dienelactone hydrolase
MLALIAILAVGGAAGCATASSAPTAAPSAAGGQTAAAGQAAAASPATAQPAANITHASQRAGRHRAATRAAGPPYAVGEQVFAFVDRSRTIKYPGHVRQSRPLVTVVRYPIGARGPFPLIVFGHGFAVTPAHYWRLLRSWAQAGYVVAAPVFPLENQHAPGGPNESDLVNQPRDMSFVITQMLAQSSSGRGPLAGMISAKEIGVSGQSDGGETALAAAYDSYYLDRRIRAAAILSGAELPGAGRFYFPVSSPPLLATQGTADVVNRPHFTYDFFAAAPRPKYLLTLLGAPHLPPYTSEQPQLSIVGRVTTAFFDRYLKGQTAGIGRMVAHGNVAGVAGLTVRR